MNTSNKPISVGKVASHAGCNVETVRYYENVHLMPKPARTPGGHRQYSPADLKRLLFIQRSRELGFSVRQVSALLNLIDEPNHTCGEVKAFTTLQARVVRQKIDDLERLKKALIEMSVKCSGGNYRIEDCPIIEALSNGPQQHS